MGKVEDNDEVEVKNKNFSVYAHKIIEKKKKLNYHLTHEDCQVLNKLVGLTLKMFISIIFVLTNNWFLRISAVDISNQTRLILLFISFLSEITNFYFVNKLYIDELESSEYENLKIVGNIDKYFLQSNMLYKKLYLCNVEGSGIYERFSQFLKISNPPEQSYSKSNYNYLKNAEKNNNSQDIDTVRGLLEV